MPNNQNTISFITTVIALGSIFLIHAAVMRAGQPVHVTEYVLAAALASTLKVRLPGIPGTFSANCLITVLAIAQLHTPDLVFVAGVCGLVQSLFRAKARPPLVQIAFNVGVFVLSATASGTSYSVLQGYAPGIPATAALAAASAVFFFINTGAVSVVMALKEGVSPARIWRIWNIWSLPYYALNAALAVLILSFGPASLMPLIAMTALLILVPFAAYQWFMRRAAPAIPQTA